MVAAALAIGLRPLSDNSFLTHLSTGRLILDRGSVPSADPYTFTAHGDPWVVQSWLASVLYGTVGEASAAPSACGCSSGTGGRRPDAPRLAPHPPRGGHRRPPGPLRAVRGRRGGPVGRAAVHARPARPGPAWCWPRRTASIPAGWCPSGWLWVNVHGSFPLGVAYLVVLLIGRAARRRAARGAPVPRVARLGILAGAISPVGPRLLVFPRGAPAAPGRAQERDRVAGPGLRQPQPAPVGAPARPGHRAARCGGRRTGAGW